MSYTSRKSWVTF